MCVVALLLAACFAPCLVAAPAGARTANSNKDPVGGYGAISSDLGNPLVLTSSSADVVVPSATCKKKGAIGFGVGLVRAETGGYLTRADVGVDCLAHRQVEYAVYAYLDGTAEPSEIASIHAGDTVETAVTCDGAGTSASVHDVNTGFTYTESSTSTGACDATQIGGAGVCANASCSKQAYLPDFGAVAVSDALVNGEALGGFNTIVEQYFEGNKNQFGPGPLEGGTAFTLDKT